MGMSRENKLLKAIREMLRDFSKFGGLTLLAMLLQHILMFWFILQSCFSTIGAAFKSLQAFFHAGKKVHKSVKKFSTQGGVGMATTSDVNEFGGDGLRQRKSTT